VNAPVGAIGPTLGTALYSNNSQTTGNRAFDIRVSNSSLTFTGSLALYNKLPNPDVPVDLNVSDLIALSALTGAAAPGTDPLYALYRTNNFQNLGEFWAGATITPTVVPIPATVLLLGSGLIMLAGYGRKKFFKK